MPNVNKAILVGRLTRDPVLSSTRNGNQICRFSLAINRKYTTPDGQQHEEVDFIDILASGRQAEICNNYLRKGDPAYVEGRLRIYEWKDKAGLSHKAVEVVMENMQLLANNPNRQYTPGELDPAVTRAFQGIGTMPAMQPQRSDVPPPPVAPLAPAIPEPVDGDSVQDNIPF